MRKYILENEVWRYLLQKREASTHDLVVHFEKKKYTKQGVYKVLRGLRDTGKIIWINQNVEINQVWLHKEIESLTSLLPRKAIFFDTFNSKKVYSVKTLTELDHVWGQLFISILSSLETTPPHILFYDLHNYTYLHKTSLVEWYVQFLYKKTSKIFLLIGSTSSLDQKLRKQIHDIHAYCIPKKWEAFVTVIDDFIIYNHVDRKIWSEMDTVFNSDDIETAEGEVQFLSQKKGTYKIVVERNLEKVKKIEKGFAQYFILPQKSRSRLGDKEGTQGKRYSVGTRK